MPIAPTALVRAAAAVFVTAALAAPARAQEPKLKDHEKKEVQSVWLLIDQAITAQVPNGATVFTVDTSKKGPEAIVKTAAPTAKADLVTLRIRRSSRAAGVRCLPRCSGGGTR